MEVDTVKYCTVCRETDGIVLHGSTWFCEDCAAAYAKEARVADKTLFGFDPVHGDDIAGSSNKPATGEEVLENFRRQVMRDVAIHGTGIALIGVDEEGRVKVTPLTPVPTQGKEAPSPGSAPVKRRGRPPKAK